jgi:tRNA (adenine57-N1/adenine58-N1)-methyltransferase
MITEDSLIYLFLDARRNYMVNVGQGTFHTDKGTMDLKQLVGKPWGTAVETNLGVKYFALKPTLHDLCMRVSRQTQIIYPKDGAQILVKSGIGPDSRIIECGGGSAAMTTLMAHFIGPKGRIFVYERDEKFMKNAAKNLTRYGLIDRVEFKNREITPEAEFDETEIDFCMLDSGSPWDLIPAAHKALKGGHRLATICPNAEQMNKFAVTLEEMNYVCVECMELIVREWLARKTKGTRPVQHMASHTGFLVFGTKTV